jgi:hypothetical protein
VLRESADKGLQLAIAAKDKIERSRRYLGAIAIECLKHRALWAAGRGPGADSVEDRAREIDPSDGKHLRAREPTVESQCLCGESLLDIGAQVERRTKNERGARE